MLAVGKEGKRLGRQHPRELKRLPAEPEKATPARKAKKIVKQFGYSYKFLAKSWNRIFGSKAQEQWFATKKARDQSFASMQRHPYYTGFVKLERPK